MNFRYNKLDRATDQSRVIYLPPDDMQLLMLQHTMHAQTWQSHLQNLAHALYDLRSHGAIVADESQHTRDSSIAHHGGHACQRHHLPVLQ